MEDEERKRAEEEPERQDEEATLKEAEEKRLYKEKDELLEFEQKKRAVLAHLGLWSEVRGPFVNDSLIDPITASAV